MFSLISITTSFAAPSAPIVYVSVDGTGDYNCDGIDDQVEINSALQLVAENPEYTTVYLRAGTYVIDNTIYIGSNTTLTGDSTTVLTLKNGAIWEKYKPIIMQKDSTGNSGITICGFKIDGNDVNITQGINVDSKLIPKPIVNILPGQFYYTMMSFEKCSDINVHDMYLTNGYNDALKLIRCTGIKFYNNKVYDIGHDGLYANWSKDIKAYDNVIKCRTNSGLRLYQSNNAMFYRNKIFAAGRGGAGIEIQKYRNGDIMDSIEIFDNEIYNTVFAAIWVTGGNALYPLSTANVHIHGNKIYNTGTKAVGKYVGGIVTNGFNVTINNNTIDGCYDVGIAIRDTLYTTYGQGYEVKINNNTITNTKPLPGIEAGKTGYGVYIEKPDKYNVIINNMTYSNNPGGDYVENVY